MYCSASLRPRLLCPALLCQRQRINTYYDQWMCRLVWVDLRLSQCEWFEEDAHSVFNIYLTWLLDMVSCGPVKKRCSWFLQSVSVCSSFAGAAQAVRSLCQRKLSQVRVTGLVQKWKMLGSRIREVWGTWIHLAAPANQHAFGMHLRIMKQMVSVHLVRTPLHHVCVIRSHCAVSLVWLCSMAQTAHVNNTCVPSWTYLYAYALPS